MEGILMKTIVLAGYFVKMSSFFILYRHTFYETGYYLVTFVKLH